jgi:hypothetical protein
MKERHRECSKYIHTSARTAQMEEAYCTSDGWICILGRYMDSTDGEGTRRHMEGRTQREEWALLIGWEE